MVYINNLYQNNLELLPKNKNEADAKYDLEYGFGIFELMQGSGMNSPSTYRGTLVVDDNQQFAYSYSSHLLSSTHFTKSLDANYLSLLNDYLEQTDAVAYQNFNNTFSTSVFLEILFSIVSISKGSAAAKIIASTSFSTSLRLDGKLTILFFFILFINFLL